jgi:Type IV secretion-system coupling protein DNA-binding domain
MNELLHLLILGSTGTGKTVAMDEMLYCCTNRGDRLIIVDPNGHSLEHFGKPGDVVLNPFDKRCPGWSIFNEFRATYNYERFAKSIIPDATSASDQAWHGYAQLLFSETCRALVTNGEMSNEKLSHWLTVAEAKDLAGLLVGTPATGLFQLGAEKALASTRFVLAQFLLPFQHLNPGDFSLRDWLESGTGNLYITWRQDNHTALKPLISAWVDILTTSILSMPPDDSRRIWLCLDELASLERLNALEDGLTKGRKHGLRVVAGLQSVAQLDAIYGKDQSTVIRSCFRNLLVLGGSNADPYTAEEASKGLGQCEVERQQVNFSQGVNGGSTTKSLQRTIEYAVLPSEIMSQKPLSGFLKLARDFPIGQVQLTIYSLDFFVPAFMPR